MLRSNFSSGCETIRWMQTKTMKVQAHSSLWKEMMPHLWVHAIAYMQSDVTTHTNISRIGLLFMNFEGVIKGIIDAYMYIQLMFVFGINHLIEDTSIQRE